MFCNISLHQSTLIVDETANETTKRLVIPHRIDKINLTPSKSLFVITGKRCEIFNWMNEHGYVEVEYNQEFDFTLTGNSLTIPLILFELRIDEGNDGDDSDEMCSNGSKLKKIFHKNKAHISRSTRMRLEVRSYSQLDENNQNYVKRQKAKNGITLQQLLKAWTESENDRRNSDYE